ncbi:MAG TPA: outer membrane protein transport protein, partial [Stellaceae bacterium]|nr:outer membrane protein transport protein [Stellaceae bacterium]
DFLGSGIESFAMGGAATAVARDPLALDTNPAGLAWQRARAIEQHIAVARAIDVGFSDALNPDQDVTNRYAPIADGGIAFPLAGLPVTVSHNLTVAGGSGAAFRDVATSFGTIDELAAKFGILRTTLGAGAHFGDRFAVGIGGSLYYARLDQKIFPGTSVFNAANPAHSFFGTYLHGASGVSGGAIVGAQYRVNERVTIGATWRNKVDLPLSGGHFTVDETALGLGRVDYRALSVAGLAEPQRVALGIAWQATPRLLIALDVKWLDWSGALTQSRLHAGNPATPGAPPVSAISGLHWRDQYVLALGAAFDLTPATVLWAGYNYGRDPIPAATLNPLLGAIGEHHVTAGFGWRISPRWMLGMAAEYLLPTTAPSTDAELPLAPGLRVNTGYFAVHAGLRWTWR